MTYPRFEVWKPVDRRWYERWRATGVTAQTALYKTRMDLDPPHQHAHPVDIAMARMKIRAIAFNYRYTWRIAYSIARLERS